MPDIKLLVLAYSLLIYIIFFNSIVSSQPVFTKLPFFFSNLFFFPKTAVCWVLFRRPVHRRQSSWNSKDPNFIAAIQWRTGLHPTWRPTNNQGDPRPGQQHRPKEPEPAAMASLFCTKGDPNLATLRRPLPGHPRSTLTSPKGDPNSTLRRPYSGHPNQQLQPDPWRPSFAPLSRRPNMAAPATPLFSPRIADLRASSTVCFGHPRCFLPASRTAGSIPYFQYVYPMHMDGERGVVAAGKTAGRPPVFFFPCCFLI